MHDWHETVWVPHRLQNLWPIKPQNYSLSFFKLLKSYLTGLSCISWLPAVRVVAKGTQQGAEEDEDEGEEYTDRKSAKNVEQHVRVAVLPEYCTQHLRRIIPAWKGLTELDNKERLRWLHAITKQHTWSTCSQQGDSQTPPLPPRKPSKPLPWQWIADFLWRTGQLSAAHREQLKKRR